MMEYKWFFVGAAVLFVGYQLFGSSRGVVSSEDAHRLVKEGALLVDVRTPSEFASGHVEGAVNIPVQEVDARMSEFGAKERPIVVYCRSGQRSGIASDKLKKSGYLAVHNLGAMSRW